MNHSEQDVLLVEKYFDEGLNEAEMKNFNGRLSTDDQFKSLVEQERIIIGAIRSHGLHEDLQYLKKLESTLGDTKVVSINSNRRWYYVAAAAVITIAVVSRVLIQPPLSSDKLFQAYFTPYANVFEPTVRGESAASDRRNAFQAYEQGDYAEAVLLFNKLLDEKNEPGIMLLVGNANLILGNIEEAKSNFTTLNSEFDELDLQSKWYLSLCYLKAGEKEKAAAILEELSSTESSYAQKAKALLTEIR